MTLACSPTNDDSEWQFFPIEVMSVDVFQDSLHGGGSNCHATDKAVYFFQAQYEGPSTLWIEKMTKPSVDRVHADRRDGREGVWGSLIKHDPICNIMTGDPRLAPISMSLQAFSMRQGTR